MNTEEGVAKKRVLERKITKSTSTSPSRNTLFPLGVVVATQSIQSSLTESFLQRCLARHSMGDWGDVPVYEKKINDMAAKRHGPVLSMYRTDSGLMVCVKTEWDRSVTTIHFQDED